MTIFIQFDKVRTKKRRQEKSKTLIAAFIQFCALKLCRSLTRLRTNLVLL